MENFEVSTQAEFFNNLLKDYVSPPLKDKNLAFKKYGEYLLRFTCMQGWFLRCSNKQKIYFLKKLILATRNLNIITTVLSVLYSSECKDQIYSIAQDINLFRNDVLFIDDNRCLNENILEQIMHNEAEWYKILSNQEQLSLILNLLQLTDTAIHNILSKEIKLILRNRKYRSENNNKPINSKNTPLSEYFSLDSHTDPNNIMHSEYTRILQIWNTFITNFKNSVEPKEVPKVAAKSSMSKKGRKSQHIDTTDRNKPDEIQTLPIWITLAILSELNHNDLKKIDKVNDYWHFAVKEVQQCIKTRKLINQTITQMKKNINSAPVSKKHSIDPILHKKHTLLLSTDPALRSGFPKKNFTTDSLITSVHKSYVQSGFYHETIFSFPRRQN